MTTELKPCPFCGATEDEIMIMADWEEATDNSGNSRRIQCADCNIEAPFYPNKNEAIEAWNTRVVPDVPELVRYKPDSYDAPSISRMIKDEEGGYVRYDQVAAIITAERQSAVAAEADNKRLREALETLVDRISYYASLAEEGTPNIEDWAYTDNSGDIAKARAALLAGA